MSSRPNIIFKTTSVSMNFGDANNHPMTTVSFPIIVDDAAGVHYVKFEDPQEAKHYLNAALDIDPTESSSMEVDGDDLIEVDYLKACFEASKSSETVDYDEWLIEKNGKNISIEYSETVGYTTSLNTKANHDKDTLKSLLDLWLEIMGGAITPARWGNFITLLELDENVEAEVAKDFTVVTCKVISREYQTT